MPDPPRPPLMPHIVRVFFLQAMWNYQNLQGTGFYFCLIPYLRKQQPGVHLDWARYHAFFNAHPYVASLALGATLRREHDRPRDADAIKEFHQRLAGPLGLVGDLLFWKTAKPAAALFGILVSYLLYGDSLAPLVSAAAFLLSYNVLHLRIRWWGLKKGWELGDTVLSVLGKPPITRELAWATTKGALFLGLVLGAVAATAASLSPWTVISMVAGGLWTWACVALRLSVTWIVASALASLLIGGALL